MQNNLQITYLPPTALSPNAWNPNVVDPINQQKIENSLQLGMFKPILAREREDGSLEILGGEHRWQAAKKLGYETVPVLNLGRMTEKRAKEITLLDNGRYGHDDVSRMTEILNEIGTAEDILSILPIDEAELAAYFEHALADEIDLDMGDPDDEIDLSMSSKNDISTKILRFKLGIEDALELTTNLQRVQREQGFTQSDELTNAGDALVWVLKSKT